MKLAEEHGMFFMEISAIDGINVLEDFEFAVKEAKIMHDEGKDVNGIGIKLRTK